MSCFDKVFNRLNNTKQFDLLLIYFDELNSKQLEFIRILSWLVMALQRACYIHSKIPIKTLVI